MEFIIAIIIVVVAIADLMARAARQRADGERRPGAPEPLGERRPPPADAEGLPQRPVRPALGERQAGRGELGRLERRRAWEAGPAPAVPDRRAPVPRPGAPGRSEEWTGEGPPPWERVERPAAGEPTGGVSGLAWQARPAPQVDFPGPGAAPQTLQAVMAWAEVLGAPRSRRPWRPPGFAHRDR